MGIEKIDKNFAKPEIKELTDVAWFNVKESPFDLYGLYNPLGEDVFKRMPSDIAKSVSEGVYSLHTHTSGGRVRFSTDSPYIAIRVTMPEGRLYMPHMPANGQSGFDLYKDVDEISTYIFTFEPRHSDETITATFKDLSRTMHAGMINCYTINFPLYDGVCELEIGLKKGSYLGKGAKYKDIKPFVYYGSSITQGGCASRPGNSYQAFISRRFNVDFINLGFSGNAKGEQEIIDYISSLDMSIFICDYDHNAATTEHLKRTHKNVYTSFRKIQKDTPILLISRPASFIDPDFVEAQKKTIIETYNYALKNGDKNVYFLDGSTLYSGDFACDCTVDSLHPNDLGFYRMAQKIGDVLEEILNK